MKFIRLTQGQRAEVDDIDFEWINQWKWYARWDTDSRSFYALRNVTRPDRSRGTILMHRFIVGVTDKRIRVDHQDHNGLHNCRENLRVGGPSINSQNSRKQQHCTSCYKGVSWYPGLQKWRSVIYAGRLKPNGKHAQINLGYFDLETEAALAYDASARRYFGSFACLNFPKSDEQSATPGV